MILFLNVKPAIARASGIALALSLAALSGPLQAQITVQQPVAAPTISQTEREQLDAQAMLTSALRRIAANGNDVEALMDAGAAANILEDARAAYGFYNRALSLSPNNGRIKAGLGSALVRLENPADALKMFDQAVQQGAVERTFLTDRGLAYDMIGDNAKAQRDYQTALQYQYSDRTLRFYALSLGISGETDRAVQALAPLLQKKDRAAWRDRAFILAMNGRTNEATEIVKATMPPNVANGLTPYLVKMNRLSNRQLALAVHYGQFPTSDAQLAAVGRGTTPPAAASATTKAGGAGGKRFVDEKGRPVRLSKAEQRALIKEQEDKQRAEQAKAAQAEKDRLAALAAQQEQARQAEVARQAERTRQAELARQAEVKRQTELAAQAERARLAEQARIAEQTRLAELQRQKDREAEAARIAAAQAKPVQVAMATPVVPPPTTTPAVTPPPAAASPSGPTPPQSMVGPVDTAPASAPTAITPIALPASTPTEPAAAAVSVPNTPAIQPAAAPAGEQTFKAFSLDDLVQAVKPPEDGPVRSEAPVDLATLEKLRQDKLRAERAEAAKEAAAKAKAEADKKKLADAKAAKEKAAKDKEAEDAKSKDPKAKGKADPKAEAKAEADKKKANPTRAWVQIATGNAKGLAGDYKKASAGKNADLFKGKAGHSAAAGKAQRLVVGPFPSVKEANAWLAKYKKNGGNGVVWTSGAGEEVNKIGGK